MIAPEIAPTASERLGRWASPIPRRCLALRASLSSRGRVIFILTGNITRAQEVDVRLDGTNSNLTQDLGGFNASDLLTLQTQTAPVPRNQAQGP
jgi:hypothetical protein